MTTVEPQIAPVQPPPAAPEGGRARHSGWLVVGAVLVFATVAGVFGYRNIVNQSKYLSNTIAAMKTRGAALDIEGCVDATIDWVRNCKSTVDVCRQFAPQVTRACMLAGERTAACNALGEQAATARYSFARCEPRKLSRGLKKACDDAYREVDTYCRFARNSPARGAR